MGQFTSHPRQGKERLYATAPLAQLPVPSGDEQMAEELRVLSPRELEVLKLVAEGYTNQEIAARLARSIKTVHVHRAHVMKKLDLENITQLVRFAVHYGLLPPDV